MNRKTRDLKDLAPGVLKAGRTVWLASLGAVATLQQESQDVFTTLVSEGRKLEARERRAVDSAFTRAKTQAKGMRNKVESGVQEAFTSTMHRLGIPTREDIHALTLKVEELTAKLHSMRA